MNPRTTNGIVDTAVESLEQLIQSKINERLGISIGVKKHGRRK